MKKSLIILNYHEILRDQLREGGDKSSPFAIRAVDFLKQMDCIQQKNIPVVSLADWKQKKVNSPLSIALTFDDGHQSDYEIVCPKLMEYNYSASFFPILSAFGMDKRMNWQQIEEMARNGFLIGSHGVNHINLLQLDEATCLSELKKSKVQMENQIHQEVSLFSLPYGMYNSRILNQISEVGYAAALSTRVKINTDNDAFLMHRVNIKQRTSLQEFEDLIGLNTNVLFKKKIVSAISYTLNKRLPSLMR